MLNPSLIVTILLSVTLGVLGTAALLRNSKEPVNRQFFWFTIAVSLWLFLNYIAASPEMNHTISLLSNRYVLVAGGLAIFLLLGFVFRLASWQGMNQWYTLIAWINAAAWMLCFTPWIIRNVAIKDSQVVNHFGSLAAIYFSVLFITFSLVIVSLAVGHYRLSGLRKQQLDAISRSIIITAPIILICNALLPISGYYGLVNYAPSALIIIAITMFYVIAKHKLFNVRLVVVRSFAYVMSLGVVSVGYALIAHYFLVRFETRNTNQLVADVINVGLISIVIITYRPLKKRFDNITNGLFYRDAYDSRELLDRLNQILISTVKLDDLLAQTAHLVAESMKADNVRIYVGSGQYYSTDESNVRVGDALMKKLNRYMSAQSQDYALVDDLPETESEIKEACMDEDILLLGRIMPHRQSRADEIGYIVLGTKRSGNPYSTYDGQTVSAIARELYIGVQNALQFKEIQSFNQTLQSKVDDATRKLRITNEKLKALDETKDEFISMASHQLRTPLTSIKGYLSMVLEGDAGKLNAQQRKMLTQSFLSSQRMVFLISDLLNLSRLNTGKFVIDPAPVQLAEIVESEVVQLQETAKAREVALVYDRPANFPLLMLDETKIHQVVMNFMDNAVYYTPAGGTVTVHLQETPNAVEYRVTDNGIGVPRAEQHHLFTKFYRAGNAKAARPDGTGLGLFMAKKVIVASGGSVLFESTEGRGSTFGFRFPKAKLMVSQAAASKAVSK